MCCITSISCVVFATQNYSCKWLSNTETHDCLHDSVRFRSLYVKKVNFLDSKPVQPLDYEIKS